MSVRPSAPAAVRRDQPAVGAAPPPLRFVSAASLFDGHDAAINMIRRLLQAHGAEVVHLGHNRSVADIVRAAIQEDADGIAVSSYQGGHNEYFVYMVDMLRELNASHIRVIVGGGGTISPSEIAALEAHGVEKIYTPDDGRRLGLNGMIDDVFARVRAAQRPTYAFGPLNARDHAHIARSITALEGGHGDERAAEQMRQALAKTRRAAPVIGITGTGGAGKSSLTDELLQRFVRAFPRAADRRDRHGSDASPLGRGAAGRSHPHELAERTDRVYALARDAPRALGHLGGAAGCHQPVQPRRL